MNDALFLSIRVKFVIVASLIVAVTSAMWGGWVWQNERKLLYQNLEAQGRVLLTALATPIINALVYEEMGVIEEGGLLDNFIEEIKANKMFPVAYAFVTDNTGKVLAHNDYTLYGRYYTDALTRSVMAGGTFTLQQVQSPNQAAPLLDMGMPLRIHGKSWGALRVGISTRPLQDALAALATRMVIVSALFFLFGTAVFYLVGSRLAQPLRRLANTMTGIDLGTLDVVPEQGRNDEIGLLEKNFHAMLRRLKKSEDERQQAVSQLVQSEKLASIGKIVAGVAHEINNPLSALSVCLYNLRDTAVPAQSNDLDLLRGGVQRIEAIVRQLLDFSRAGTLNIEPVPSDQFFRECVDFAKMAVKKRAVTFSANDHCTPPLVLSLDKGKIHQVILNLVLNAADASPPGGVIDLVAFMDSGMYCLAVKDQGSGVPAELHDRIFDIFFSTKPPGEGSGIGLAVCKSIVEMHRGEIFLRSSPGYTTFMVRLPLMENQGRV
jgi:signal transduction histidine kinase